MIKFNKFTTRNSWLLFQLYLRSICFWNAINPVKYSCLMAVMFQSFLKIIILNKFAFESNCLQFLADFIGKKRKWPIENRMLPSFILYYYHSLVKIKNSKATKTQTIPETQNYPLMLLIYLFSSSSYDLFLFNWI